MKIRLEDIPQHGIEIRLPNDSLGAIVPRASMKTEHDFTIGPDVSGTLFLTRDDDEILMSGSVQSRARLKCSRCLTDYDYDLNTEINLVLKVSSATSLEEEAELKDNEIAVQGPEIELGDIIFQEIVLDIPMKPLCSEDCPGLCPTCGAVRGSEQCKCDQDHQIDPRWLGLKKIKDQVS